MYAEVVNNVRSVLSNCNFNGSVQRDASVRPRKQFLYSALPFAQNFKGQITCRHATNSILQNTEGVNDGVSYGQPWPIGLCGALELQLSYYEALYQTTPRRVLTSLLSSSPQAPRFHFYSFRCYQCIRRSHDPKDITLMIL